MNTAALNKADRIRVLPCNFRCVFFVVSALVLLVWV
jgi:hypothetical protein